MREIVHLQAGQCGNQIGAKVSFYYTSVHLYARSSLENCQTWLNSKFLTYFSVFTIR